MDYIVGNVLTTWFAQNRSLTLTRKQVEWRLVCLAHGMLSKVERHGTFCLGGTPPRKDSAPWVFGGDWLRITPESRFLLAGTKVLWKEEEGVDRLGSWDGSSGSMFTSLFPFPPGHLTGLPNC